MNQCRYYYENVNQSGLLNHCALAKSSVIGFVAQREFYGKIAF